MSFIASINRMRDSDLLEAASSSNLQFDQFPMGPRTQRRDVQRKEPVAQLNYAGAIGPQHEVAHNAGLPSEPSIRILPAHASSTLPSPFAVGHDLWNDSAQMSDHCTMVYGSIVLRERDRGSFSPTIAVCTPRRVWGQSSALFKARAPELRCCEGANDTRRLHPKRWF